MFAPKNSELEGFRNRKWFRVLCGAGLGLAALILTAGAVGLFLYDQYFYSTPTELYHRTWDMAQRQIFEPKDLKDWQQWEHKFDDKIVTNDDAVKHANEMLKSLNDRYTMLLSAEQTKDERRQMDGKFIGIGVVLDFQVDSKGEPVVTNGKPVPNANATGHPLIKSVMENSPAAEVGIKAGDAIKSAGGHDTSGLPIDEVIGHIRGPEGQAVKIIVTRDGKDIEVEIVRKAVSQPAVEAKMLDNGIGYLRLNTFAEHKNHDEVVAGLKKLESAKGIVFDLRNNGGGFVHHAISISSLFVEKGSVVVIKQRSGGDINNPVYTTNSFRVEGATMYSETSSSDKPESVNTKEGKRAPYMIAGRPVVILINGHSASASEMVTGAIRDNNAAVVIGERSFGKGIGQSIIPMPNGTMMHITSLRYYTPNGTWLGDGGNSVNQGIEPDIEVKANKKRFELGSKDDNQLEAAVEHLKAKLSAK